MDEEGARDPLARRRARQARLVQEQRKRIAEEERDKTDAEASIRSLQQELTRLLEANANLQRKVPPPSPPFLYPFIYPSIHLSIFSCLSIYLPPCL